MKIHFPTPYRVDKNLGRAYNEEFLKVAEDDYVCLRDCDTLFLLHDTPAHIYGYVEHYPEVDFFTCYANRNHAIVPAQILGSTMSEDTNILNHIKIAREQSKQLYRIAQIQGGISGFVMLIKKKLWNEIKFPDGIKCLGVDLYYSTLLRDRKKKVYRMNGVYVWHTYRLENGTDDRKHLL